MKKPFYSIGIIFKNEIRCLERCLKSLQLLRESVSCELVMADTGSTDGSRSVAERYADILFDFPWIDDFAAARNAVMERCCGAWYLTVDADEWLGQDISELAAWLPRAGEDAASVIIRNYGSYKAGGRFADVTAVRLLRMSTGERYEGCIHERWAFRNAGPDFLVRRLSATILHHDGYADMEGAAGKEKRMRNLTLLRKERERKPDDLRIRLQIIESSQGESWYQEELRQGVRMVEAKKPGWQSFGPSILRYAVQDSSLRKRPELEGDIRRAEHWFPDSPVIRLDVNYFAAFHDWEQKHYKDCIERCEAYQQALRQLRDGGSSNLRLNDAVMTEPPYWEMDMRLLLANAYLEENWPEPAKEQLEAVDGHILDTAQTENAVRTLQRLHSRSSQETADLVLKLYREICWAEPSRKDAEARRQAFVREGTMTFFPAFRKEEEQAGICRPAYTLYLPLLECCSLGAAAAILETGCRDELERCLGKVDRWEEFPIAALEHALGKGVCFPPPENPLKVEEMDRLAEQMARQNGPLAELAISAARDNWEELPPLAWARALVLAAVRHCTWANVEQGIALSRAFAKVEGAFLSAYYARDLLCSENICLLPPLHRFGWYCGRAFWAMEAGDSAAYVRLLREGLENCPEQKLMVEFLLKQLEKSQCRQTSPELLALAERVQALLRTFPAGDPAAEALKQSAACRQVAYLIERTE